MRCSVKQVFATITLFIGYSVCEKVFRDDYVTIGSSFYKYHATLSYIDEAKETCEFEGATLFYPENEEEISSTWLQWAHNEVGSNSRNLLLGVYVLNATTKETITIDDKSFNLSFEVRQAQESGKKMCMFLYYPSTNMKSWQCDTFKTSFFCKKPKASVQWNEKCKMATNPSNGYDYEYDSKLGKCYKLHTEPRTWETAVNICKAEQSNLTELNSQDEANHLKELVSKVPEDEVGVVCLGFKKTDVGWAMLSGKFLHESGYPMWAHTQPDGGEFERLGAMAYNGRLHDIGGNAKCVFVCERDL